MLDIKLKTLQNYIENNNLGIEFSAHHLEYIATFEKQYHLWQVVFKNNNSKIIEETRSFNNKFFEPSFTDLVYEMCICTKAFELGREHFQTQFFKVDDNQFFKMKNRGKRFQDLKIDYNFIDEIVDYKHEQKWKLV